MPAWPVATGILWTDLASMADWMAASSRWKFCKLWPCRICACVYIWYIYVCVCVYMLLLRYIYSWNSRLLCVLKCIYVSICIIVHIWNIYCSWLCFHFQACKRILRPLLLIWLLRKRKYGPPTLTLATRAMNEKEWGGDIKNNQLFQFLVRFCIIYL